MTDWGYIIPVTWLKSFTIIHVGVQVLSFGRKACLADTTEYLLPHSAIILFIKTVGHAAGEAYEHRAITGALLIPRFLYALVKCIKSRQASGCHWVTTGTFFSCHEILFGSFTASLSISATDLVCWCLSFQGASLPGLPRRGQSPCKRERFFVVWAMIRNLGFSFLCLGAGSEVEKEQQIKGFWKVSTICDLRSAQNVSAFLNKY